MSATNLSRGEPQNTMFKYAVNLNQKGAVHVVSATNLSRVELQNTMFKYAVNLHIYFLSKCRLTGERR